MCYLEQILEFCVHNYLQDNLNAPAILYADRYAPSNISNQKPDLYIIVIIIVRCFSEY